MNNIAYLANSFPEAVESYVWEEIFELRRRGQSVVPCSFRRPKRIPPDVAGLATGTLYVFPLGARLTMYACWLCIARVTVIADLLLRAIRGPEAAHRRLRTLVHTWFGVYLAVALRKEQITHIHVHHGYFSSWAGMVAARLLGTTFSITLHGSDLLVRADYLDCKLKECRFCVTVSEFNRRYILQQYPAMDSGRILVHRLAVDLSFWRPLKRAPRDSSLSILAVGRLHPIKNHDFLIRACGQLKAAEVRFRCSIAGEGEERRRLHDLIHELRLEGEVDLLGHVPRERLRLLYSEADIVALTSLSEGIPQTLMEAMAMEGIVLAPAITGIPELVQDDRTGFLYQPNSMPDFLGKLFHIAATKDVLDGIRREARRHIDLHFSQQTNLRSWANDFVRHVNGRTKEKEPAYADPVLQQVQLPVQRNRSIPV